MIYSIHRLFFGSLHPFSAKKNILGVDSTSQISGIPQVDAFNVNFTAISLLQPKHGKLLIGMADFNKN